MDPISILKKVKANYLEFASYEDHGTVQSDLGELPINTHFQTYFVRPDNVRFEWQDGKELLRGNSNDGNVVRSNGTNSGVILRGQYTEHKSLSAAMASTTGASKRSVAMILKLLQPDCIGLRWYWGDMTDARLLNEEEVDGLQCHYILGSTQIAADTEAWISKEDYIIRRLRTKRIPAKEITENVQQRVLEVAEKLGIPQDEFPNLNVAAGPYCHQYTYDNVRINGDLSNDLFRP